MKSLKAEKDPLADPETQLDILNTHSTKLRQLPDFEQKLKEIDLFPLKPTGIEIFQVNLGYMCNMTCKHCHVDAGPDREEIMNRETLEHCLEALRNSDIRTVDLTGGAPEMNPHFNWFVEQVSAMGKHIIVRSNLTILTTTPSYRSLPEFFARHGVEVVCSLPFYNKSRTDRQRGRGTYDKSVEALKMLNAVGYGKEDGLELNLVFNPTGAFLPANEEEVEREFKKELKRKHGIEFNNLFGLTNLPISRFLNFLLISGNLDEYMERLVTSFNPAAARGVMCRDTISIGWDGTLYDCDFNQMLEMEIHPGAPGHVRNFDEELLNNREIMVNQHCYGCTAGAGSSCGGQTA